MEATTNMKKFIEKLSISLFESPKI